MAYHLVRALLLGTILALIGAGCGGDTELGAKALAQQSKSLWSAAAEGALLAQDAASGKTTRIYTREHSSDLQKAAAKVEARLKAAGSTPGPEPELRRLEALAARVSTDLDRLGAASEQEQRALGRELQAAARESEQIGERLG